MDVCGTRELAEQFRMETSMMMITESEAKEDKPSIGEALQTLAQCITDQPASDIMSAHSRNTLKQLQFSKLERQTKSLWNKIKLTVDSVQVHTLSWVQLCCCNRRPLMSNESIVAKLTYHKQLSNGG
ncbi:unnamed protein product [Dicrocoelium dendriticum]|nr:unnamed protein product [Dicrocoelium dendriticum]